MVNPGVEVRVAAYLARQPELDRDAGQQRSLPARLLSATVAQAFRERSAQRTSCALGSREQVRHVGAPEKARLCEREHLIADGNSDSPRTRGTRLAKTSERQVLDRKIARRIIGRLDPARECRIVGGVRLPHSPATAVAGGAPGAVLDLECSATDLVALERFEQRLEITLTETLVIATLDELEEHRPKERLREDLQQQPRWLAVRGLAIEQDAPRLESGDVLAVTRQALLQHLVIDIIRCLHQRHPGAAQPIDTREQIVAAQCDVLDALAVELHEELLDLTRAALGGLFIEWNADQAVWSAHCARGESRVLPLDVEVADLAEVEDLLVEGGPETHPAPVDVVGQVIDHLQTVAIGSALDAGQELEVDVVDRFAVLAAIDQVKRCAADALDGRESQLHGAGRQIDRLGTELERARVRLVRVCDAEGETAGARTVLG